MARDYSNLEGYDEAIQAKLAHMSPRMLEIDRLERFVLTTQYDGRKDWFDQSAPLFQRRPCIAYKIVRNAIDSNTDLCLGEGRFPAINVAEPDDDGGEQGLSEDEAKGLNKLISDIQDQARLKRASRIGFAEAQGCKSVAIIAGIRRKKLFLDVEKAKWSTPTFDPRDPARVQSLEIKYPYLEDYKDPRTGKWMVRARLYRRVIDDQYDTTFLPADADKEGREPNWQPDPVKTFAHGFGRCPVVWYAHMMGCSTVARIDGRAIHEDQTDEVVALDFALSQRHRAALLAGDPQWTEIGVGPDDGPKATGETELWSTAEGGGKDYAKPTSDNPATGRWISLGGNKQPARKKGPGEVWQYDNPDAKVTLHTLPGDALKAISDHAADIRTKLAEGLGVVFTDPELVRFASAMSGKAQELLKARQLDRCDQYRDDMADGLIRPTVYLLLQIALIRKDELKLQSLQKVASVLETLLENDDLPELELRWGPYFKQDAAAEQQTATALAAVDKVLPLPLNMKVRKLKGFLGIENVQAAVHEFEDEQEKRQAKAAADMQAQADLIHASAKSPDGAVGTGNRGAARKGPPPNAGGGGAAAATGKAPNPVGGRRSR